MKNGNLSIAAITLALGQIIALPTLALASDADTAAQPDTPATAATPAKNQPGPTPANSDQALEEVVVTGIRASLEKSLDTKRGATVVLDSISATELGRFPDADVADSLRTSNTMSW